PYRLSGRTPRRQTPRGTRFLRRPADPGADWLSLFPNPPGTQLTLVRGPTGHVKQANGIAPPTGAWCAWSKMSSARLLIGHHGLIRPLAHQIRLAIDRTEHAGKRSAGLGRGFCRGGISYWRRRSLLIRVEVLYVALKLTARAAAQMKAPHPSIAVLDVTGEGPIPVPVHVREAIAPR